MAWKTISCVFYISHSQSNTCVLIWRPNWWINLTSLLFHQYPVYESSSFSSTLDISQCCLFLGQHGGLVVSTVLPQRKGPEFESAVSKKKVFGLNPGPFLYQPKKVFGSNPGSLTINPTIINQQEEGPGFEFRPFCLSARRGSWAETHVLSPISKRKVLGLNPGSSCLSARRGSWVRIQVLSAISKKLLGLIWSV